VLHSTVTGTKYIKTLEDGIKYLSIDDDDNTGKPKFWETNIQ